VTELLPLKAAFHPDEDVRVELRGLGGPATVRLWHLDELVSEVHGSDVVSFGRLPPGGYGVEAGVARTAIEVCETRSALRYGFAAEFASGRNADGLADTVRRLHLNAVMFYDWMYRHARLLPPEDEFDDALGRRLSLDTVRRLAAAVAAAGAAPLGYAAVYAVGRDERDEWSSEALLHPDGTQWQLGDDFLWLVDPGSARWVRHLVGELRTALSEVGFAGFHLDQFGWPKAAVRPDGSEVDLAEAFPALIADVRGELDSATLIFNNVNDFPTHATAAAPQDAVYIEVWSPHDSLEDLTELVRAARGYAPRKPVCLAAYLSTLPADETGGAEAMRLMLAAVLSRGGTCLLHGEEAGLLVDPYYVRHHLISEATAAVARSYADFSVRFGELLFADGVDVTQTHWGGINEEIIVQSSVPVSAHAAAGSLWLYAVQSELGLVIHLIDLSAQSETAWDVPKRPAGPSPQIKLAVARVASAWSFQVASPETAPALTTLASEFDGRYDSVDIPPFSHWAMVWARPRR
jgi:dextranase